MSKEKLLNEIEGKLQNMLSGLNRVNTKGKLHSIDIDLFKSIIGGFFDSFEITQVGGVGEAVDINKQIFRVTLNQSQKQVGTDKPGPAGYHNISFVLGLLHKIPLKATIIINDNV